VAETSLTSGLLARKPVEASGPSLKMGLVLTAILLLLLGAIAVWSILFLPDSPMARLFSSETEETETAILGPDLDAPALPEIAAPAPATEVVAPDPLPEDLAADTPALDAPEDEMAALPDAPVLPPETDLPDIDADLVLEPLPPLPEDLLPSLEETERIYAEDGIWPRTPDRPSFAPFDVVDRLYIASIDPATLDLDAIALPAPDADPTETFARIPSPPPFGSEFEVDPQGLVAPTPEGVLTPEGAFVILGRPPVTPPQRPREPVVAEPETPAIDIDNAILGTVRPTARPGDLDEVRQRQVLGGLTVTELAARRPTERPQSAQEQAAQASLFQPENGEPEDRSLAGTELAVATSPTPRLRPSNIDSLVAAAVRAPVEPVEAVPAVAAAPQPSIPSNASVTRAATERNAMRLRDVNLIGVTGTPSNRTALVRLPSGRFVRVSVGDRLDGGRVAAIGEDSLQYVRRGQNITLDIPG
jgi:hypothetical protein